MIMLPWEYVLCFSSSLFLSLFCSRSRCNVSSNTRSFSFKAMSSGSSVGLGVDGVLALEPRREVLAVVGVGVGDLVGVEGLASLRARSVMG